MDWLKSIFQAISSTTESTHLGEAPDLLGADTVAGNAWLSGAN